MKGSCAGNMELFQIAHIESKYKEKFGIPRQSNLVKHSIAKIVFETEYRRNEAVRGLEEFSHIWILWGFHKNKRRRDGWTATVRPPKLGGKLRKGVFATRSPNRPNPIGLSCVEILDISIDAQGGPSIYVSGADMLDGTPVYDIKPFIPYTDNRLNAKGSFSDEFVDSKMKVSVLCREFDEMEVDDKKAIIEILEQDPRGAYEKKENYEYGILYGDYNVKFHVTGDVIYIDKVERDSFIPAK